MTTLYFRNGTCALAPHVVLEWIGAPYEAVPVAAGSALLLELNPAGAVPVLKEDDGWILTQGGAILRYLAAKHPEAGLGGSGGLRGAAELDRWSSFLTGDLHPSFFPVFGPMRYTTDPSDEGRAKVVEAALGLVRKRLNLLEAHMAGREWILDARSVVDAYALPMLRWGRAKLPEQLERWPALGGLVERLEADAAVRRVLAVHAGSVETRTA
ncbi:MAG: glutathione S-transferase family protein [Amaricoccus sp.]|uniref:glutathione S-transferase family protein n=1 Tax=Amaricoccus sp. TaxID=1872485 RepID=UPI0039E2DAC3